MVGSKMKTINMWKLYIRLDTFKGEKEVYR